MNEEKTLPEKKKEETRRVALDEFRKAQIDPKVFSMIQNPPKSQKQSKEDKR